MAQEKEKETLGKEKNSQVLVVADLSKHEGILRQQQQDIQRKIAKTNKQINAAIMREIEEARRKAEEEARAEQKAAAAKAKAENKEVPAPKIKLITKNSTNSEILNSTPEAAKTFKRFFRKQGPAAMASNKWKPDSGLRLVL